MATAGTNTDSGERRFGNVILGQDFPSKEDALLSLPAALKYYVDNDNEALQKELTQWDLGKSAIFTTRDTYSSADIMPPMDIEPSRHLYPHIEYSPKICIWTSWNYASCNKILVGNAPRFKIRRYSHFGCSTHSMQSELNCWTVLLL